MSRRKKGPLGDGYDYQVDITDEQSWYRLMQGFEDGNVFQTWAYAAAEEGPHNLSPFILTLNGEAVAAALVRFRRLPLLGIGLAYVHRGPMWRRNGVEMNQEHFRQVLRGLRNEFVCKRGLTLRLNPALFDNDTLGLRAIILEERFLPVIRESTNQTILMDLTPPIADLLAGMDSRWRRGLKGAEKNNLELIEGTGEELIDDFVAIYQEMLSRKKFISSADPQQFRRIQTQLPEPLKLRVLLCKSAGELCAGLIYSRVGTNAIFLFGATSNDGMNTRGSYLLHWKAVEALKREGIASYNLNGIDPVKNHGTYVFKKGLAGKHGCAVHYIGRFDASAGSVSHALLEIRDVIRAYAKTF